MKLKCNNCGSELSLESKFCTSCGTKVEELKNSKKTEIKDDLCSCGNILIPESKFCTSCGAKVGDKNMAKAEENTTSPINQDTINKAAKAAEETLNKVAQNTEEVVNKAVNSTKEFVANNKGSVKPFLIKNKLILIIVAVVIAVSFIGVGILKLQASPKKTVESFAKSFSKLDVEKALKYTNAETAYNTILDEYGGTLASFILEVQKELVYDYGKFKMEVIDMEEIFKTSNTANYYVTFKLTSDIDSGSPDVDVETMELSFIKEKGKWLINFMSLADYMF